MYYVMMITYKSAKLHSQKSASKLRRLAALTQQPTTRRNCFVMNSFSCRRHHHPCHNSATWKVIMFLCVLIELNVFWAKFMDVIAYDLIELRKLSFSFISSPPPPTAAQQTIIAAWSGKFAHNADGWERRERWELNNLIAKPRRLCKVKKDTQALSSELKKISQN